MRQSYRTRVNLLRQVCEGCPRGASSSQRNRPWGNPFLRLAAQAPQIHADSQPNPHRSGRWWVMSFALGGGPCPLLYARTDDSGRSNRLILLGVSNLAGPPFCSWGMSSFVSGSIGRF